MVDLEQHSSPLSAPARFSCFFMLGAVVLIGALRLAGPLVVALFTFLALSQLLLPIHGGKFLSLATVLILLAALFYGLGFFIHSLIQAFPEIGGKAVPAIIAWAKEYGIQLPITDYDSLKTLPWTPSRARQDISATSPNSHAAHRVTPFSWRREAWSPWVCS